MLRSAEAEIRFPEPGTGEQDSAPSPVTKRVAGLCLASIKHATLNDTVMTMKKSVTLVAMTTNP